METRPYHIDRLLRGLEERQRKNPAFSLRAYARLLGVQAPSLSAMLKNKRNIPAKSAQKLIRKLALSPLEEKLFIESIQAKRRGMAASHGSETSRLLLDEESHFRIIAEWEHYAILSLMDLKKFHPSAETIAKRLGISISRADRCLKTLRNAGFIREERGGRWKKTGLPLTTTEDIASRALRHSHEEGLELAKRHLDSTAVSQRDFSSITFVLTPRCLSELKRRIRKFRKDVAALAETEDATEVYQLAIQLFPLTQVNKTEGEVG